MKIYIKPKTNYYHVILYVLKLIEKNQSISFIFVEIPDNADIIWDTEHPKSEYIHIEFYKGLLENEYSFRHKDIFGTSQKVSNTKGIEDIIASLFYMVNSLQEYKANKESLDTLNRFKYTASYQAKFNSIEENLVQNEIDLFCKKHQIKGLSKKSNFFVSHDIDTIYGSFLQDGLWAVKNLKIGTILNLIIWELSRNHHWRNIEKIAKMDNEYDIRSTFFWLVNKGKGIDDVVNADYELSKEQELLQNVEELDCYNGLHKSSSLMTINEELEREKKLLKYNRYHFLKFAPHKDWKKISDSSIEFDSSLGFAEHYGFRNSYGKAFQPFNILENKPYDFVEAPLHFMDGTFHKYMNVATNTIADIVINFYENNSNNCNFSLLWHNTYFTNYKYHSFIKEYKKIISYLYDNKIESISPQELIEQNRLEW